MSAAAPGWTGMRGFRLVWAGQTVSLIGTGLAQFALAVWAYQLTGQATALAAVAAASSLAGLVATPFAGAFVDRGSRKRAMLLADLGAGAATVAVLILYSLGTLQIWHLVLAGAWSGAFQSIQFPAYGAAITTMVPKEQYSRASAMMGLADSFAGVMAPLLAGATIALIGVGGLLIVDVVTFVLAIAALLPVVVPPPAPLDAAKSASFRADLTFGFRYLWARQGLFALLLVFLAYNLILTGAFTLSTPMILARTGEDTGALGVVQAALGLGGVVGGIVMSTWRGFRRRIFGLFVGMLMTGVFIVAFGLGGSVLLWALAGFGVVFFAPVANASSQAIWQQLVEPAVQGRVFAARRFMAHLLTPLAAMVAGVLADSVAEPALIETAGRGAGMALLIVIYGVLGTVISVAIVGLPAIRALDEQARAA